MRVLILAVLFLLAIVPATALGDEKDDRTVWAYEGGWFSTKDSKTWVELSYSIYNDNAGKPFEFKEVQRTKEHVVIYDGSRKLSVRLAETTMEWREDGQEQWNPLHKGQWKRPQRGRHAGLRNFRNLRSLRKFGRTGSEVATG
jgi:hypothetical protein